MLEEAAASGGSFLPMTMRAREWCGLVLLVSSPCWADVIWVNGAKWDDRYGQPKNVTGIIEYRDGDKVRSREQYVDGEKDGPYVHFDLYNCKPECKPDETGTYRHGKREGITRKYRAGVLEGEYAYAGDKNAGVQKSYRDGALERLYVVDERGQVDADLYFNPKGQLTHLKCGSKPMGKQDETWCGFDGKQSTVTLYSKDGAVSGTEQYLWGKLSGTKKQLNVKTGIVMREEQYEEGHLLQGGQKHYNREGALLSKTDCDEKRTSCTETNFFPDGQQTETTTTWKGGKIVAQKEYYQNGKVSEELAADGERFRISDYTDLGQLVSKGTYIKATQWYWRAYIPDGVVERYADDGSLAAKANYKAGVRQGSAVTYWQEKGHRFREEAEWDKDGLTSQKLFADDKLTDELEYFPDGSLKNHREVSPSPLTKI
jgi:antitoxin component YwqK of YwqJK toxin-antitoxin module